jgi:hypothetical protein
VSTERLLARDRLALLGLVVAFAAGCGGGSDDSCGRVAPCGGEVVGAWKLSSACSTAPPLPAKLCAAATVRHSSFDVSGTATFGADLSFSLDANASGTIEVSVPTSCLTFGDATATCAQITPQAPAGVDVQCVESGDGCLCTFVILAHAVSESGTYSTSGSMLMDTPAGGAVDQVGYCVAGDRLHLITLDPVTAAAANPIVISDVVGTRENH